MEMAGNPVDQNEEAMLHLKYTLDMHLHHHSNTIRVKVFDYRNRVLDQAEVEIRSKKHRLDVHYHEREQAYVAHKFAPDTYTITVSAQGLVKQSRTLYIGQGGAEEMFILGKKGMSFFYRGNVIVPIELNHDEFGIAVKAPEKISLEKMFTAFAKKYKIKAVRTHENYQLNGIFIFTYPEGIREGEKIKLRQTIQKQPDIRLVAPILKRDEKNVTLLTDEIIARFKGNVSQAEIEAIARKMGLRTLRIIPYAGNAYHFKVTQGNDYFVLGICHALVQTGKVEYAEPNVLSTSEDDAITPNNFLYPEQWDHPLIDTPNAWQVVNDRLGAAQQFGSPNILIAVVDSGVNTAHPQFNRNVSNGQPKVFSAFDFVNMVANTNALAGSHGTCCASASTGFTPVSSVVGGVPDGSVGIAGNCQLLAIRRGGTEALYADMYIWAGGFNPNSATAGFPAQLARGADVITSSFGFSINNPISGLMRDTFDFLTTYGRNGKGVALFFSAGNQGGGGCNGAISTLLRPWAAYQKCMGVSASTLANDGVTEVLASYSNFGPTISFCAPSNDNCTGTHNPPANYGAFTGTILNNAVGNDGNTPRNQQVVTNMTANAAAGTNVITVTSTAGMAVGQAIYIGNPSANISTSEAKTITGINAVTNTINFTPNLFNNQPNGQVVLFGNRDYVNNFGGTSYSTPVCAGIAALMLSVNNRLTWMEIREILRNTAIKIDPNNTNAAGRWVDTMGRISTNPMYTGPFFSQFYGYGRVSAVAAVTAADTYTFERDILVRDNMLDDGTGTSAPPFWTGVDIWVRNINDGVAPANYNNDANTVHLDPIAGQPNFLNIRFKNRGTQTSFPFYIRAYIAHFPGMEFTYPNNFMPSVRPNGVIPNPLTPGTYLIGEQQVSPLNAGGEGLVTMEWAANLIPPQSVMVSGMNVQWHPCILVEVSPHDGFVPTGNHVWDDNNLAQKNISITYSDSTNDGIAVVMGQKFKGKFKTLRFEIFPEPRIKQPYFIHFPVKKMNDAFIQYAKKKIPGATIGKYRKANVVWINAADKVSFELPNTGLTPMIVGLGRKQKIEHNFDLHLVQYADKKVTGSYGISFKARKTK